METINSNSENQSPIGEIIAETLSVREEPKNIEGSDTQENVTEDLPAPLDENLNVAPLDENPIEAPPLDENPNEETTAAEKLPGDDDATKCTENIQEPAIEEMSPVPNHETNLVQNTTTIMEVADENSPPVNIPETICGTTQSQNIIIESNLLIKSVEMEIGIDEPEKPDCEVVVNRTENLLNSESLLPSAETVPETVISISNISSTNTEQQATADKSITINSALSLLQAQYTSDDSNDSDNGSLLAFGTDTIGNDYRDKIVISSSESDGSDDSDVECLTIEQQQKVVELDQLIDEDDEDHTNRHHGPVRVKGELLLEDLPPIQDLFITVPEAECVQLGNIHSIVEQLVLVDALPGTVPLDLDTVLFMEKGKSVLGKVFDVLGQIKTPLYCVRFNSNLQIKEKGIEVGQQVFVAPRTEHTQFIILDNLMTIRGSDASWENDVEPNDKNRDFSDDEEERNFRRNYRNNERPFENDDSAKKPRTYSASSSTVTTDCDDDNRSTRSNQRHNHNSGRGGKNYRSPRNQRQYQSQHERNGYESGPGNSNGNGQGNQYGYGNQSTQQFQNQPTQHFQNQPTQQFQNQPTQQFQNQNVAGNYYQNPPPSFNYTGRNDTWHANYNSYRNNYPSQQSYQPQLQLQPQQSYQPQLQPQHPVQQQNQPSNLYPNPFAMRPPFIPPNAMQQELFPPPPPPSGGPYQNQ